MRLGIHTSTAGSLEGAALQAAELGANTFQIFSASPRMWRARAPEPAQVRLLHAARERLDLHPLVIHAGYLINLASLDPGIRAKSIAGFRGELERAAAIGAEYLVVHPGSYKGHTVEEGIAAFVEGLRDSALKLDTGNVTVLLENTAGAGSHLGSRFEELHSLRKFAVAITGVPIGFCLDTCHLLAAGFDIASEPGLAATLHAAQQHLGLEHVHVMHANDSKGALASHLDRHANIGAGHIGDEAFRRILHHPLLRAKPFILETPVDEDGDDRRNLDKLKSLAAC